MADFKEIDLLRKMFIVDLCAVMQNSGLTLLHSEWPKLHRVLAILSAVGLCWILVIL